MEKETGQDRSETKRGNKNKTTKVLKPTCNARPETKTVANTQG
jgi:hypothetical protein